MRHDMQHIYSSLNGCQPNPPSWSSTTDNLLLIKHWIDMVITRLKQDIHPRKQTWNLKMPLWEKEKHLYTNYHLYPIVGFHVSFRGCTSSNFFFFWEVDASVSTVITSVLGSWPSHPSNITIAHAQPNRVTGGWCGYFTIAILNLCAAMSSCLHISIKIQCCL